MTNPLFPHPIKGTLSSYDGASVVANTRLLVTNTRTNATLSTSTDAVGRYRFDCASFAGGYQNSDLVVVELNPSESASDFVISISPDNGSTWQVCTNNVTNAITTSGQELVYKVECVNAGVIKKVRVEYA